MYPYIQPENYRFNSLKSFQKATLINLIIPKGVAFIEMLSETIYYLKTLPILRFKSRI